MSDTKKSADHFYKVGNDLYEKGEFRQAIFYYEEAIKRDPLWSNPYYNKGLAYACLENYDAALKDLQKVIELKPDYAEAYYIQGLAYQYKEMNNEAIKSYKKAIELNPDYNDAKNRLTTLEQKKSMPKTQIDSCADYKNTSADFLKEINEFERNGQLIDALAVAKKGLEKQPDNIHLLLYKRILEEKIENSSKQLVVCGLEDLKEAADKFIIFPLRFANNPLYKAPIAKSSKGFLIFGPPGCGKTLFIKSLATQAGLTLIEIVLSDVLNLYCGESEKRLTEVFSKIKETAKSGNPVLVFIDEVDALGFARTMTPDPNEAAHSRHFIATFLKLLDEIREIPEIVVVGATNRLWCVDEALKRPGRLGSVIFYVSPPNEQTRKEMFKHYTKETPGHKNLDFKELARLTPWFSGDDIRSICREVHFEVARDIIKGKKKRCAELRDFVRFIQDQKLQTISWIRQVTRYYDEGKIDSKEVDEKLLDDIERCRKNEFSSDGSKTKDHDDPYIY